MNDLQEDKLSYYRAVTTFFNEDAVRSIWEGVDEFAELVSMAERLIEEIDEEVANQEEYSTGVAVEKKIARDEMVEAALKVVNGVRAHAVFKDNKELQQSIHFTKKKLVLARDNMVDDMAKVIYTIAYPLRNELGYCRITEEDIERLNQAEQKYSSLIPTTRIEIINRKSATENLKMKFEAMDDLLNNKINAVIQIFGPDHPEFVRGYFDSRRLVRTGIRHPGARLKGRVVKADTDEGIAEAKVVIRKLKRERMSDENGDFKFLFKKDREILLEVEIEGKIAGEKMVKMEAGKDREEIIECRMTND